MGALKVFVERQGVYKSVEIGSSLTVKELLRSLRVNPVTVIVTRNGEVVIESENLKSGDNVKVLSVISGG